MQGNKGQHAGLGGSRCFFGERAKGRSGNGVAAEDQRVHIVDLIDVERENPRISELAENDFAPLPDGVGASFHVRSSLFWD
ncbi:hypothetical protein GCM10009603_21240 [Nocardiopsis exhalans]